MPKKDFDKARKPTPPPYSIRFSWEQRAELDRITQGQSWGSYIKEVLFLIKKRVSRQYSELDWQLIAKLLGALGKSRLSSNLNQLARAVNSGSLPVNEGVSKAILQACRTIEWMRITLIEAMGIKAHRPSRLEHKSDDFER